MKAGVYKESEYNEDIVFIDWIDTVVKGYNLATYIICEYERLRSYLTVLPGQILGSARGFWADWLNYHHSITDDGKIKSQFIDQVIEEFNVNKDDIQWDAVYVMDGVTIDELKERDKETM